MKAIFNSATKLVLMMMTFALIGLTAFGKVSGQEFMTIVGIVFTAYYVKKSDTPPPAGMAQ